MFPDSIDEIDTANSGAPVPNATMVRPISCLLTLKFDATEDAPSTSQSAPLISITNPNISSSICPNASIFLL